MKAWGIHFVYLLVVSFAVGPLAVSLAGRRPNVFASDLVVFMGVVGWSVTRFALHRDVTVTRVTGQNWLILYVACVLVGLPAANDMLFSLAVAKLYLMPLALYALVANLRVAVPDVRRAFFAISCLGVWMGCSALYNWQSFYTGHQALAGNLATKDMVQTVVGRSNSVAGLHCLLVAANLCLLLEGRGRARAIAVASLAVLGISVVFAMSRGSYLGLTCAFIVFTFALRRWAPRRYRTTHGFAVSAVLLVSVAMGYAILPRPLRVQLWDKISIVAYNAREDNSSTARLDRWAVSLDHSAEHPLGIGVGNYQSVLGPLGSNMGGSAHNFFLETLNETGVIGLVALLGLLTSIGGRIVQQARFSQSRESRTIAVCSMFAFVFFVVNVSVEPNYYSVVYMYLFWLMMALSFGAGTRAVCEGIYSSRERSIAGREVEV